jgi:hypothetical protein
MILQADAPIIAQLCGIVSEEDLEVAAKATKALEMVGIPVDLTQADHAIAHRLADTAA